MSRTRTLVVLFALVGAAFAPSLEAGTADNPEINDPNNDGGGNGLDIVKVYFDNDATTLNVTIQLTAQPPPVGAFAMHNRFVVWTKPTAGLPAGMGTLYFVLRFSVGSGTGNAGQTTINGGYAFSTAPGTYNGPANEPVIPVTTTGSTYRLSMPLANLKGFTPGVDSFKELYAQAVLMSTGTTNGDATSLNLVYRIWDRAPNTGFGRDYASVGATSAVPQVNLTAEPQALSAPAGGNASFKVTASSADAVNLTLNTTGDLDVAFPEPALAVPAGSSASTDGSVSVPDDAATGDTYSFTVHAWVGDQEVANVTITLSVEAPPSPSANTTAPQNGTTSDAPASPADADEGGVPGFGFFAMAMAVAVLVGVMRRRR